MHETARLHDIGHLLTRVQASGEARINIDATDLFALVGALAWIYDQPVFSERADHLFEVAAKSVLCN